MSVHRRFPCEPDSAAGARHFAKHALRGRSDDELEAVELMVSELATNAITHAESSFEVMIESSARQVRVEVKDLGPGVPVLLSPAPHAPSGRGLLIVAALANDWGATSTAEGTTVWFELALDGADAKHGSRAKREHGTSTS